MSNNQSSVYTVEQACEILRISRTTAYAAVASGDIPSIRIGKSIKIPKAALDELLKTGLQPEQTLLANDVQVSAPVRLRMTRPSATGELCVAINAKIPISLNNKLVESATKKGISLSNDIICRLQKSFEE